MPTSASAKKRVRQSEKIRLRNRAAMANLRTRIKKVMVAIEEKDLSTAQAEFRTMESTMDTAARKGLIHRNTASRKKSRIARQIKELAAG